MLIVHIRNKKANQIQARGGATVLLDIEFPNLASGLVPLEIQANLGLAVCHKDDNFNKKTGRELAFSKYNPAIFYLYEVSGGYLFYKTYVNRYEVSFSLNIITKKFKIYVDKIIDLE